MSLRPFLLVQDLNFKAFDSTSERILRRRCSRNCIKLSERLLEPNWIPKILFQRREAPWFPKLGNFKIFGSACKLCDLIRRNKNGFTTRMSNLLIERKVNQNSNAAPSTLFREINKLIERVDGKIQQALMLKIRNGYRHFMRFFLLIHELLYAIMVTLTSSI